MSTVLYFTYFGPKNCPWVLQHSRLTNHRNQNSNNLTWTCSGRKISSQRCLVVCVQSRSSVHSEMNVALLFLYGFSLFGAIECYKILGVFPTQWKSHWNLGSSILRQLAAAGHDITYISPFELNEVNVKNVILTDYPEGLLPQQFARKMIYFAFIHRSFRQQVWSGRLVDDNEFCSSSTNVRKSYQLHAVAPKRSEFNEVGCKVRCRHCRNF